MFKLEAGYMLIIAGFELVLYDFKICMSFPCVTLHDSCLVYNMFLEAFSLDWARCFSSAIARSCLLRFTVFVAEDCLIVAGDDLVDVIHTAITQFDCILLMIL